MSLLTPEQYAKKHGISRATVYRRIRDGKLPVVFKTKKLIRLRDDDTVEEDSQE